MSKGPLRAFDSSTAGYGTLTGDLASQDAEGRFHHLGRTDNQVKVLGNRVELEEVEAHLRKVSGQESVAAVAWPVINGSARDRGIRGGWHALGG